MHWYSFRSISAFPCTLDIPWFQLHSLTLKWVFWKRLQRMLWEPWPCAMGSMHRCCSGRRKGISWHQPFSQKWNTHGCQLSTLPNLSTMVGLYWAWNAEVSLTSALDEFGFVCVFRMTEWRNSALACLSNYCTLLYFRFLSNTDIISYIVP